MDQQIDLTTKHFSDIHINISDPRWGDGFSALSAIIQQAFDGLIDFIMADANLSDAPFQELLNENKNNLSVGLKFCSDQEMRRYNKQYRGKDKATNVLTFAENLADNRELFKNEPLYLGDIIFAFETIQKEADEQDKPITNHLIHLFAHGLLHALGFDHEKQEEAAKMEAIEIAFLKGQNIPNPYES